MLLRSPTSDRGQSHRPARSTAPSRLGSSPTSSQDCGRGKARGYGNGRNHSEHPEADRARRQAKKSSSHKKFLRVAAITESEPMSEPWGTLLHFLQVSAASGMVANRTVGIKVRAFPRRSRGPDLKLGGTL
jgi:hypothetical protein